jgi:hypothetical protein
MVQDQILTQGTNIYIAIEAILRTSICLAQLEWYKTKLQHKSIMLT